MNSNSIAAPKMTTATKVEATTGSVPGNAGGGSNGSAATGAPTASAAAPATTGVNTNANTNANTNTHANANNTVTDNHVVVRPTEAQLRWAQFHFKRRAVVVREKIERMYQSSNDIVVDDSGDDGDKDDNNDDGEFDDTSGSDTSLIRDIRHRRRPEISDGRRALLKRSRQKFRQRRQSILKHGYREGFSSSSDNNSDGFHSDDNHNSHNKSKNLVRAEDELRPISSTYRRTFIKEHRGDEEKNNSTENDQDSDEHGEDNDDDDDDDDDDDEAALDEIFMSRPKRQRRRRHRTEQDKESYKRFQAACHAMMMNVKKTTSGSDVVVNPTTTKRWTRSEEHRAEAMNNVDYLDYKWGIGKKGKHESIHTFSSILAAYYSNDMAPMDRGASWLMHASKHVEYSRDTPYYHDVSELPPGSVSSAGDNGSEGNLSSSTLAMRTPGPKKFHQLVSFVQRRLIEKERLRREEQEKKLSPEELDPSIPRMRLRESHLEDDGVGDEGTDTGKARAIAELLESKDDRRSNSNSGKIRQMAKSLEGDHTPTMKLKSEAEFFGSHSSKKKAEGSSRRRSRYVPRMTLREFKTHGDDNDDDIDQSVHDGDDEDLQTPRMKLVHTFHGAMGKGDTADKTDDRQKEVPTMKLHGASPHSPEKLSNQFGTPKMKLSQTLPLSQEREISGKEKDVERATLLEGISRQEHYEIEEKKEPEPFGLSTSATKEEKISRSSISPQTDQPRTFRNIKSGSARVSAFFGAAQTHQDDNDPEKQIPTNDTKTAATSPSREEIPPSSIPDISQDTATIDSTPSASKKGSDSLPVQDLSSNSPNDALESSPAQQEDSNASNLSSFWNPQGRNSSILSNAFSSGLNAIAEASADPSNPISSFLTPEIKARASDASGRVSGMFNKLRGVEETSEELNEELAGNQARLSEENQQRQSEEFQKSEQDHHEPHALLQVPSGDSHAALAAYHEKRASMTPRESDQHSAASSFRPLPAEIREAVQKSGSSPRRSTSGPSTANNKLHNIAVTADDQNKTLTKPSSPTKPTDDTKTKNVDDSVPLGDLDNRNSVIDTDETQSDASPTGGMNPQMLAGLMMSPDVLQKRLGQAIRAVEQKRWDHVQYLINANPWLSEMKELTTNQYLLHKLAYFGGGADPAPDTLVLDVIEKFPSAVYKFDEDGNVPLHLAAASKNLSMVKMLGEKFESGASIRNEDGFLPLHFAIASYANIDNYGSNREITRQESLKVVKAVLKFFPQAVAIADNDGNLPLHVAAECLDGGEGADVIYILMDEAERQMDDPDGARFRNKVKLEEITSDDMSMGAMSTERETDSSVLDDDIHCTTVVNENNETPLHVAIRSQKGWEIIEAILSGKGGRRAALHEDAEKNNALHLLVGKYQDATAAMSILKVAPESSRGRNANGALPIEVACMHFMPEEVILSIALVDLPINIDDREVIKVPEGQGGSWSFLTCESDDHFVSIVHEIVSICSFQQIRELCFMKDSSDTNVITRATPQCRLVLSTALRFMGRFEFVGNGPVVEDTAGGHKIFEALDFGDDRYPDGKRVLLECFDSEVDFEKRVNNMLHIELDDMFVEEVNVFVEYMEDAGTNSETAPNQHCVSIERPKMTLDKVVAGMTKNGGYKGDPKTRKKYTAKMCSVLRLIGKAIRHLHDAGAVHGNISMRSCCKFEESWKLGERLSVQIMDEPFDSSRFQESFPPEAVESSEQDDGRVYDSDHTSVRFNSTLLASKSIDIWAFGKLAYESLVGKPLIKFDDNNGGKNGNDSISMLQIMEWDQTNMHHVFSNLLDSGLGESGADLITSCLFPRPEDRPSSMDEILSHEFWQEMKQYRSKRRSSTRKKRESRSMDGSSNSSPHQYEI